METIDEISPRDRQREKEIEKKETPIGYTGIMLDDTSIERLSRSIGDLVPDDWEYEKKPHVTLKMGGIKPEDEELIRLQGWPIPLYATHIGMNDKAVAVVAEIESIESHNETPHITVAYDALNGARPKDSKQITEWKPLRRKIRLRGTIEEVPAFNREGFN